MKNLVTRAAALVLTLFVLLVGMFLLAPTSASAATSFDRQTKHTTHHHRRWHRRWSKHHRRHHKTMMKSEKH